jgi:hypothetical protein
LGGGGGRRSKDKWEGWRRKFERGRSLSPSHCAIGLVFKNKNKKRWNIFVPVVIEVDYS